MVVNSGSYSFGDHNGCLKPSGTANRATITQNIPFKRQEIDKDIKEIMHQESTSHGVFCHMVLGNGVTRITGPHPAPRPSQLRRGNSQTLFTQPLLFTTINAWT